MFCLVLAMEILQGVWKQHLGWRTVVGYGVKIFLPRPPNYVTRSPGERLTKKTVYIKGEVTRLGTSHDMFSQFFM